MAAEETVESPEFMYLPLGDIIVEEQIRSSIDTESDSFKALMESIKERGVIEPIIVTPRGDKYLLVCGERRYMASSMLDMESIPVRILDAATQKDEILAYQLTENLQREDLNPIDQAKGILAYIQARHPDLSASSEAQAGKNYDVDGVMNDLIKYDRRPDDLTQEIVETVSTISEIAGKTVRTLFNGLSLLKLSDEIQAAIRAENLPVSQGYLFAANLDCPDLMKIFNAILKTPVTNAALNNLLTAWKKPKPDPVVIKLPSMTKQVTSLISVKTVFEKGVGTYVREDLEKLLYELQVFCDFVQQQVPLAPYGKEKPPQV
ncbi:MAG: ParB/RepB/Spo0J family partition protein [Proteobacteria bacterium]|nr:ParB/RepB/Spo0J family partition protein [Pseudomonadota bacterium]